MAASHISDPAPSRPEGISGQPDLRGDDIEKDAKVSDGAKTVEDTLNESSEITYVYLTFDVTIPAANTTISTSPGSPPAPAPPNLKEYGNPLLWPAARKYTVLALSCIATFLTAYTAGSYSPPASLIQADLGAPSTLSVLVGITTFCVGFALAPMVLAPFSEINGRYPVFVVSGIVFVVFQAVCGVVRTLGGMLVARFFTGVGGSVFSTMVGGVLADIWRSEERNTPMAVYSGSVLAGTGMGPLVGAIMTRRLGHGMGEGTGNAAAWKWIFWHQVIMGVVLMVALVFLFKESRGSVLLSRQARALNNWYAQLEEAGYYGVWAEDEAQVTIKETTRDAKSQGRVMEFSDEEKGGIQSSNSGSDTSAPPSLRKVEGNDTNLKNTNIRLRRIRWRVKEDEERSSVAKMISISLYRPFHLLFTEPVVFFFSLWVAFAWAVLYLTFGSIPLVFQRQHGWNIEEAGHVFIAMIVGAILATAIGIWQEHVLHHPQWQPVINAGPSSDAEAGQAQDEIDTTSYSSSSTSASASRFWAFMRRRFPVDVPESRLYFTCLTSTLLPIGLYLFGLTSRPSIHWLVPAIAIALATMGIYSVYLATFNYLADTYHKYASSALAAQSCCRNLLGGAFPLVTGLLFRNLGEARAGGLLGGIATGLTIVPWVLVFAGERIRRRSPFASELVGT